MKGFVVDTNVISETIKSKPNENALKWLSENAENLFLASITIEELRFGELMMPKGKKREGLRVWIDALTTEYSDSILSFDADAAVICAKLHEHAISTGRTPSLEDLMIAAIALSNDCAVVTRNIKDFEYLGIDVIDPFQAR